MVSFPLPTRTSDVFLLLIHLLLLLLLLPLLQQSRSFSTEPFRASCRGDTTSSPLSTRWIKGRRGEGEPFENANASPRVKSQSIVLM